MLIVEPDDDTRVDNKALAYQLRKHGDRRVTEVHIATDHPFSDHRIALQVAVVRWLDLQSADALRAKAKAR